MINITVDKHHNFIDIEGGLVLIGIKDPEMLDNVGSFIQAVLDKAYYGGEVICLQWRNADRTYNPEKRWEWSK